MNEDVKAILWNIVGGVIVAILTSIFISLRRRIRHFHLQRLLGFRFSEGTEVRITYGQLMLPPIQGPSGQPVSHPYIKKPRNIVNPRDPSSGFSMEHAISECEVRASTYLTAMLAHPGSLRPLLVSDSDVVTLLNSNFIALGGPASNYKTEDILSSPANILLDKIFPPISPTTGEPLIYECNNQIDHGIILRITSPQFRKRSWIVCAGLGEWGTSGSAWYLANKWEELLSAVHPAAYRLGFWSIPDFLAVVRVTRYQDQSTEIASLYRRSGNSAKRVK